MLPLLIDSNRKSLQVHLLGTFKFFNKALLFVMIMSELLQVALALIVVDDGLASIRQRFLLEYFRQL